MIFIKADPILSFHQTVTEVSMEVTIRQERVADHAEVYLLTERAFEQMIHSDHREMILVQNLRKSEAFIPELSLVAVVNDLIIGHLLLTKIKIKSILNEYPSLALAPVSVMPEYQSMGVGSKLISHAHEIAGELGYESIIVLGHPDYYPRFGYQSAKKFGIQLPFEVPAEYCMAIELVPGGLKGVSGLVAYPKEFY